jgi:transposase InsO family protein
MARKVAPMDTRMIAAVTASLEGLNVTKLCKQHGISTKTFYKWRNRYEEEGLAGLYERSRRPHSLAKKLPDEVEDQVVRLRHELIDKGLDGGSATIRWHLQGQGLAAPSEASIWRMLVRRGVVTRQPKKRPRSSYVRFEAALPNECWQIDATERALTNGQTVWIFNIIDDHSRVAIRSMAVLSATTQAAWSAFSSGIEMWGIPSRCLSDNGLAFSGKLRGYEVIFETNLRAAGIKASTSRPYHPQTCGKVERFQQTLKKWLRARPRAGSLTELQDQLDEFCKYYNHQRPHRSIGRVPPYQRWSGSTLATPDGVAAPEPPRRSRAICQGGKVCAGAKISIGIGAEFSGKQAEVVINGANALVFIEGRLVRALELDPTRTYQPSGLSPGRRTRAG